MVRCCDSPSRRSCEQPRHQHERHTTRCYSPASLRPCEDHHISIQKSIVSEGTEQPAAPMTCNADLERNALKPAQAVQLTSLNPFFRDTTVAAVPLAVQQEVFRIRLVHDLLRMQASTPCSPTLVQVFTCSLVMMRHIVTQEACSPLLTCVIIVLWIGWTEVESSQPSGADGRGTCIL